MGGGSRTSDNFSCRSLVCDMTYEYMKCSKCSLTMIEIESIIVACCVWRSISLEI